MLYVAVTAVTSSNCWSSLRNCLRSSRRDCGDVGDIGDVSVPLPETEQTEHDVEVEAGVKLHVKVAKAWKDAPCRDRAGRT
jgi:hypothetical protein